MGHAGLLDDRDPTCSYKLVLMLLGAWLAAFGDAFAEQPLAMATPTRPTRGGKAARRRPPGRTTRRTGTSSAGPNDEPAQRGLMGLSSSGA